MQLLENRHQDNAVQMRANLQDGALERITRTKQALNTPETELCLLFTEGKV